MKAALQTLIREGPRRKYPAGSTLVYQGEVPSAACVLASGVVKVYSISQQGEEQVVTFHVGGEFFPSSWIFGKAPNALFFYEALSDCEVVMVDRRKLLDYMLATDERLHAMLDYFTTNYAASLVRINSLQQSKAREKLVYTLYYLCQRYAKDAVNTKRTRLPLSLTHQTLASLVGLTRETTAVEMNKLKRKGVITYDKQQYIVNQAALLKIIGEESFEKMAIADRP